jgi:hypothetical protein
MRRTSGFYMLLLVGIVLLGGGLFWGFTSHQVSYKSTQGKIEHYLSNSDKGVGYLQMSGSPNLYYIEEKTFSPAINGLSTLRNGDTISFTYQPSVTTSIDVEATNTKTTLKGTGYKVIKLTVTDGAKNGDYVTSEYKDHPTGYFQNNWLYGGGAAAAGVLLALLAFLLPQSKQRSNEFSVGGQQGQGFSQNQGSGQGQPYPPFQQPYDAQPGTFVSPYQDQHGGPYQDQSGPYPPQIVDDAPFAYPPPQQQGYPYNQPGQNPPPKRS